MSWFDEQIRERKLKDDEIFADAISDMAKSVLGHRLARTIDNNRITNDAIDEVFKYYGLKMPSIPDKVQTLDDKLEYAMRPYGIMRRKVRITNEWYKDAIGPMIGTMKEDGKPIALIPGRMGGYRYNDHSTGRLVRIDSKNAQLIDEEAYTFYKPFPLRKITIRDIITYIADTLSIGNIIEALVAAGMSALIGMMIPAITHMLFSDVIPSRDYSVLMSAAVLLITASTATVILGTINSLVTSSISVRMDNAVSSATMMRVLSLPARFFRKHTAGELTEYIDDINVICKSIVNVVLSVGLTSIFSLCYIVQILRFAPSLLIPALAVIIITIAVSVIATLTEMGINKKRLDASTKESSVSYQIISGVMKIRLAGAEKRAFAKWGKTYSRLAELSYNPPTIVKVSGVITNAVSLVGTIIVYYVAIKSNVQVADFYAFESAYSLTFTAIMSLVGMTAVVAQIRPILELVKPIFDAEPEVSTGRSVITGVSGTIEVNNVSFKYDEDGPMILDGLDIKIKSGQYIAIVGKTGCGKSTLVRLLLGFETPTRGAIYYDGKDVKTIDAKSLRQHMGVVIQNGQLFSGEIYQNILIAAPNLTMDDAWEAARIAQVADDIENMPMGMNTYLSEGSGGISGGQKQRLLIARAVAHKPKILIFDEATSALDNITQKQVVKALDELKCTRIVIAHRLSTIKNCDRILVLDGGKIVEDGTYDELVNNGGMFSELVERQRLDV